MLNFVTRGIRALGSVGADMIGGRKILVERFDGIDYGFCKMQIEIIFMLKMCINPLARNQKIMKDIE